MFIVEVVRKNESMKEIERWLLDHCKAFCTVLYQKREADAVCDTYVVIAEYGFRRARFFTTKNHKIYVKERANPLWGGRLFLSFQDQAQADAFRAFDVWSPTVVKISSAECGYDRARDLDQWILAKVTSPVRLHTYWGWTAWYNEPKRSSSDLKRRRAIETCLGEDDRWIAFEFEDPSAAVLFKLTWS